jgi:hypothetical protein
MELCSFGMRNIHYREDRLAYWKKGKYSEVNVKKWVVV